MYLLNSDWKKKYPWVEETANAHCDNDCQCCKKDVDISQMGEMAL